MDKHFDVVVVGSGAAGLTAALFAANSGARVLVLERSALLGGTSAISGGQVWVPNNRYLAPGRDTPEAAMAYLQAVTLGQVAPELLQSFVDTAPAMVASVERLTGLQFAQVDRADYHPAWPGAGWGRSLEPLPANTGPLGAWAPRLRISPHRPPLTSAEIKRGAPAALAQERRQQRLVTQGAALVCGLLRGCLSLDVQFRLSRRVVGVGPLARGVVGVHHAGDDGAEAARAGAVVLASGGFEWNEGLKQAFLNCPDEGAASPPWNDGDGLRIGLQAGAAVRNMTEAWWSAAYRIPGEQYDGRPLVRNIVKELALPGSLLVNADGRRFANEAASYNALGKAFQVFDAARNQYPNRQAWLVFDAAFKQRYTVAGVAPQQPAPAWFLAAPTLGELAERAGIHGAGLVQTVEHFNAMAEAGVDGDFGRGQSAHDRYHADHHRTDSTQADPNLGPLRDAPFYAVPVFLGNLGTKGGLQTDACGRVLDMAGVPLAHWFACGNVAASWMGPGYPGAGGSLGPIMAAAALCGPAAAAAAMTFTPEGVRHGT